MAGARHNQSKNLGMAPRCGHFGKVMKNGLCYECNRRDIDKRYYANHQEEIKAKERAKRRKISAAASAL